MSSYQKSFRHLVVWQKAKILTKSIYMITKNFPQDEKFGIISQLKRASSSIMANIAEGNQRKSKKERCRFIEIARGSLVEVDCHIDLALELEYLSIEDYNVIEELINKTGYLLYKFEQSQVSL
jgi:four helix bundle protein